MGISKHYLFFQSVKAAMFALCHINLIPFVLLIISKGHLWWLLSVVKCFFTLVTPFWVLTAFYIKLLR